MLTTHGVTVVVTWTKIKAVWSWPQESHGLYSINSSRLLSSSPALESLAVELDLESTRVSTDFAVSLSWHCQDSHGNASRQQFI